MDSRTSAYMIYGKSMICAVMESDYEMGVRSFLSKEPFCLRGVPHDKLKIFCTALTHDSYSNEKKDANPPVIVESYERLEFLGDAILEFIVCEAVYANSDLREGAMTDFKIDKVDNKNLSDRVLAYGMDIDGHMRVGGGHLGTHGVNNIEPNMRADVFEALVAASYLTYGLELSRQMIGKVILGYS